MSETMTMSWLRVYYLQVGRPWFKTPLRALATDSLKESVSLHLGKKREKTTKKLPQQKP
jgi:hypothetical protein